MLSVRVVYPLDTYAAGSCSTDDDHGHCLMMPHCTACAARITSRNYTKFLVDRNGQPVKRLKPAFDPVELERDVSAPDAPPLPLCTRVPAPDALIGTSKI